MSLEFRPTSPIDAPVVAEFLQRIFVLAPGEPLTESHHLHWKNWGERAGWPGSRGYVLTVDGSIVAHATIVPLAYASGSRRLRMIHLTDWAADPTTVGAGVFLMQYLAELADVVISIGGSAMTQKVLPAMGFKSCGEVTYFVQALRPLRRVVGQKLSLRLAAQFARSVVWMLRAPSLKGNGWKARRVTPDDLASEPMQWPRPHGEAAVIERSAELMRYFLDCPSTPMELYTVTKDGAARGYFLLSVAPGQMRIADFYINSELREEWRALLLIATAQARQNPAAAEVVTVGSDDVTRQALLDCGFHARAKRTVRALAGDEIDPPTCPIRLQMVDNDAAYLHTGKPEYWS